MEPPKAEIGTMSVGAYIQRIHSKRSEQEVTREVADLSIGFASASKTTCCGLWQRVQGLAMYTWPCNHM